MYILCMYVFLIYSIYILYMFLFKDQESTRVFLNLNMNDNFLDIYRERESFRES